MREELLRAMLHRHGSLDITAYIILDVPVFTVLATDTRACLIGILAGVSGGWTQVLRLGVSLLLYPSPTHTLSHRDYDT